MLPLAPRPVVPAVTVERQPFSGWPNDGDGIRQRRLHLCDHMFWRPTRRERAGARRVHECQYGRRHEEWRWRAYRS
jgi:hypothetical protein